MLVLLLAFFVRLGLSWHPGYGFDIGVYEGWARSGATYGMAESYEKQVGSNMLPDYPPLSITILTGVGHAYNMLFGAFDMNALSYRIFIKMPATIADLMICGLLYGLLKHWKGKRAGIAAALMYALNPAAIFDTAVWGQTDSIYTFFLLAALSAWAFEHRNLAAVMLALSVLTKMQAIVLFPLFAFLVADRRNPTAILRFTIVGILTIIAVLIPYIFGGVVQNIVEVYTGSVGRYGNVTIGAYNFWWALLGDRGWQIHSRDMPFFGISYTQIGLALFATAYCLLLWIFRRHIKKPRNIEALLYCAAMLCCAFFLFLTQMHERYLFPFVALGIPMCFIHKNIAAAYWTIVVAFTLNLMGILPVTALDRALFREFDTFDVFLAATVVWMFVYLTVKAWQRYGKK